MSDFTLGVVGPTGQLHRLQQPQHTANHIDDVLHIIPTTFPDRLESDASPVTQTASRLMETRTERMQPCMQQTELRSTARLRMPCWMPWKLQRQSTMPRRSQVPHHHSYTSAGGGTFEVYICPCIVQFSDAPWSAATMSALLLCADPKRLSGMIEDALNGNSQAPASPRGIAKRDLGQQKPLLVPDSTREKVRERILAGLQKNGHLSSSRHDLDRIAADCEDTCYSNSKSKYASNPLSHFPDRPSPP